MNYIVFDLEWNQGSSEHKETEAVLFEIVEIGAVKLNDRMEQVERFHEVVRPQVHRQMHRITGQLIGLDEEELRKGRPFPEAAERFLTWCREAAAGQEDFDSSTGTEEFVFCTWGTQDLTELQRNMRYYGMEPLSDGPIPFLDVQKLFSIAYEDRKTRRALEYAVDYLHIEKDEPFHRADGDAYYTGKVLAQCSAPEVLRNVSYDVYHPPLRRGDEIRVQFENYEKYISRAFADKEEALKDREVTASKCFYCHRNLRKKIKWFTPNGRHYYCVAYCEVHGYLKGKIRVQKTDEDQIYIVKTTRFITPEELEGLMGRKEHVKELRRKHRLSKHHKVRSGKG